MSGNNLQLINLPQYQVQVSPNINIAHTTDANLDVTGNAYFPFIVIKTNAVSRGVTLPAEVTFVGQKNNESINLSNMSMRIQVSLGNRIFVAYQNLLATLGGQLTLSQIAGGLPTASGTLYIKKGVYYIYNQFLTIQNGRLIYLGNSISDPGLNIRAIKSMNMPTFTLFGGETTESKSNNYVGALVRGRFLKPEITLISKPAMSQNDILSNLVFGSSQSQLSSDTLSALGPIASSLNLVQPSAGDGETTSNPLTSGIMKLGMFNPVQAFNFSIPLTPRWMIRTEASLEETGIDMMYEYETE